MERSIDLLERALKQNNNLTHWCNQLGYTRKVLSNARGRGRLSPPIAGKLARALGESDAETDHWIAVAALEAENDPSLMALLQRLSSKATL